MDRYIKGIKRISVISFSVIYLLLAFTYMQLLPNYNFLLRNGYYFSGRNMVTRTSTGLSAGGRHAQVQKLFYATPENKKELLTGILLAGILFTTLFTAAIIFLNGLLPAKSGLAAYAISHRHSYLQYRSLRL